MKSLKKIASLMTASIILINTAGCTDKTWALKSETDKISTGVYVYNLLESYQAATDELLEKGISTSDIKNETIEDKNANDWIKDRAITSCKDMLAIEKIFKDMNLSLSDEDNKKAEEITNDIWETSGTTYEKNFGINKDSVNEAYSLLNIKKEKIFDALYGKDGTNPVSDEELNEYYKNNYICLKFYTKMPFEDSDANEGESAESATEHGQLDTDESIQNQFGNYVESINSGATSINQIAEDIKSKDNIGNDTPPLETQLVNPESTELPKEITEPVKTLEPGKSTYIKYNDIYLFLYREPNLPETESLDLSNETERDNLLHEMKSKEFENKITDTKNSMKIDVNTSAINQYDPAMFEKSKEDSAK